MFDTIHFYIDFLIMLLETWALHYCAILVAQHLYSTYTTRRKKTLIYNTTSVCKGTQTMLTRVSYMKRHET